MTIVSAIVEGAAIYTICLLVQLILTALDKIDAAQMMLYILPMIVCIAPTLIVLRLQFSATYGSVHSQREGGTGAGTGGGGGAGTGGAGGGTAVEGSGSVGGMTRVASPPPVMMGRGISIRGSPAPFIFSKRDSSISTAVGSDNSPSKVIVELTTTTTTTSNGEHTSSSSSSEEKSPATSLEDATPTQQEHRRSRSLDGGRGVGPETGTFVVSELAQIYEMPYEGSLSDNVSRDDSYHGVEKDHDVEWNAGL